MTILRNINVPYTPVASSLSSISDVIVQAHPWCVLKDQGEESS
jgi:hypothetical protein